jgi:UDP-galactopyranose mutase
MERYYPVRDAKGVFQARYQSYARLAQGERRLRFIGRCGTYTYLDMHQVINQSLQHAAKLLDAGLAAELARRLRPVSAAS